MPASAYKSSGQFFSLVAEEGCLVCSAVWMLIFQLLIALAFGTLVRVEYFRQQTVNDAATSIEINRNY